MDQANDSRVSVNIGNARLFGLERDLGMTGNQFQLSVSLLFVTYCVSLRFTLTHNRSIADFPNSCLKLHPT